MCHRNNLEVSVHPWIAPLSLPCDGHSTIKVVSMPTSTSFEDLLTPSSFILYHFMYDIIMQVSQLGFYIKIE